MYMRYFQWDGAYYIKCDGYKYLFRMYGVNIYRSILSAFDIAELEVSLGDVPENVREVILDPLFEIELRRMYGMYGR